MKLLILLCVIYLWTFSAFAIYVEDHPKTLQQPDGTAIHCFASGDEFYNWVHDADHYTIVRNPETKYWVYAVMQNGKMTCSDHIVGRADPEALGIPKNLSLSSDIIAKRRLDYYSGMYAQSKGRSVKSLKQSGTINNIVVFIRFSGETEFPDQTSTYDSMFNSSITNANSLYNYFTEASYNQVIINSTLYPETTNNFVVSYQDINPREYFQPFDASLNPTGYLPEEREEREHGLLFRAIESIDGQVPAGLDLDFNMDGYVDNVCFIIRGDVGEWAELLWPHRWALYSQNAYINGLQVWDYNFQLEEFFFIPTRGVGVLCHEMFHTLGAPDLYHYDTLYRQFRSVGYWDLMDRSLNPSEHMCAYMKNVYGGWIDLIPEITTPGTYTLNPLTSPTNNCYMIASPNSFNEYFVLEYRKMEGGFENSLHGEGLLIYRINSDSWGYGNSDYPFIPDEVYVFRPDGIDTVTGQIDNAAFSLNSGRTSFGPTSNPACLLVNGNPGGITITEVSAIGNTISFCYNCPVSVPEISRDAISVYPNPAVNVLVVKLKDIDCADYTISVSDISGKKLISTLTGENEVSVDISSLPAGIYFIEASGNGLLKSSKFVKHSAE